MELPSSPDFGHLPFTTLTVATLYQILGPTAKYLGVKTQDLTQKGVENLERIFKHALDKMPEDATPDGTVPPRVLRAAMTEGLFTEDEIAAAYLGGVLASSKTENGRDDRGVSINAMISRLSVFQLRLHCVAYRAIHSLIQGVDSDFGTGGELKNRLHFGTTGLMFAMGFIGEELHDPNFDISSVLTHALYGLSKEELIQGWEFRWDRGLICSPTPIGVELYLWANGHGRKPIEYFFNREFDVTENDEIVILRGREFMAKTDAGTEVVINGFDYASPLREMHCCKLKSSNSSI